MRSPSEVLDLWLKAFNARDARAVSELYHEDAVNLQIAVSVPLVGRKSIHKDVETFFSNIPDSFTNLINKVEAGEWVSIEWTGGGTFKPTGKKFEFRGCGFFQVVDGKIKTQRGYWDMGQWCRAVGVPLEIS